MIARSTDITSFTEHRKHLREHFDRVKQTGRPLYVTSNGQTEAVVLSPEQYDRLAADAEMHESLASLDRGMQQGAAGQGRDFREAIRDIAKELGLRVDR